ncbi:MAG: dethiobiotin synthase [Chromatiales bacterium]|nr:dethiobiotin synthase [Chromatiales bacterium]
MSLRAGCFVTGTDTGVGKTLVAAALLLAARASGLRTAGFKPVASGCTGPDDALVNEDALLLQHCASEILPYRLVNPVALREPIAPHIAAARAGLKLEADTLARSVEAATPPAAGFVVVEGAGGWLVPLNDQETLARLAARLALPVVMVVGLRLGCINHALLTAGAITAAGLRFAGWVGSQAQPEFEACEENLATLRQWLAAPCLGIVPWLGPGAGPEEVLTHLDASPLLEN